MVSGCAALVRHYPHWPSGLPLMMYLWLLLLLPVTDIWMLLLKPGSQRKQLAWQQTGWKQMKY